MKDFNYAYQNLQNSANELKNTHFQQSGKIELGEIKDKQSATSLVKILHDRYSADWKSFEENLILDSTQRGYDVQKVLQNFPEPNLPEETIRVALTGNWESYDG